MPTQGAGNHRFFVDERVRGIVMQSVGPDISENKKNNQVQLREHQISSMSLMNDPRSAYLPALNLASTCKRRSSEHPTGRNDSCVQHGPHLLKAHGMLDNCEIVIEFKGFPVNGSEK